MNAIIRSAARHPLAMALTATFCYSIMSTLVKYVSASYSTGEILVFRGLFGMLPPLIYVQLTASWGRLRGGASWPHALRALAGMSAQGLSYAALALVPLSTRLCLADLRPSLRGAPIRRADPFLQRGRHRRRDSRHPADRAAGRMAASPPA